MSFCFAGALAQAATVTGTVTDKTTGKPAAGDAVALVAPMMGMSEVGNATTDAQGHYSLNEPGSVPYLIRVTHQGADYFVAAPQGGGAADISVYDVAPKVDGVTIDEHVIGVETDNGQLRVVESYTVHNASEPPRTQWSKKSFEIILPSDAVLGDVSAQRPGTGTLPTTVKLDPDGPKGHYSFNFPIQPDEGGKGTLFRVEYQVPYSSGKYAFHAMVTLPVTAVWVVLPKVDDVYRRKRGGLRVVSARPQHADVYDAECRSRQSRSNSRSPARDRFRARIKLRKAMRATMADRKPAGKARAGRATSRAAASARLSIRLIRCRSTSGGFWAASRCCWRQRRPSCCAGRRWRARLRRPEWVRRELPLGYSAPAAAPAAKNAALLNALKEELFALESEKIAGTLAPNEYAEQKAALETVLRRALKKQ